MIVVNQCRAVVIYINISSQVTQCNGCNFHLQVRNLNYVQCMFLHYFGFVLPAGTRTLHTIQIPSQFAKLNEKITKLCSVEARL